MKKVISTILILFVFFTFFSFVKVNNNSNNKQKTFSSFKYSDLLLEYENPLYRFYSNLNQKVYFLEPKSDLLLNSTEYSTTLLNDNNLSTFLYNGSTMFLSNNQKVNNDGAIIGVTDSSEGQTRVVVTPQEDITVQGQGTKANPYVLVNTNDFVISEIYEVDENGKIRGSIEYLLTDFNKDTGIYTLNKPGYYEVDENKTICSSGSVVLTQDTYGQLTLKAASIGEGQVICKVALVRKYKVNVSYNVGSSKDSTTLVSQKSQNITHEIGNIDYQANGSTYTCTDADASNINPFIISDITSNNFNIKNNNVSTDENNKDHYINNDPADGYNCTINYKYNPKRTINIAYVGATSGTSSVALRQGENSGSITFTKRPGYSLSSAQVTCDKTGYTATANNGVLSISNNTGEEATTCTVTLVKDNIYNVKINVTGGSPSNTSLDIKTGSKSTTTISKNSDYLFTDSTITCTTGFSASLSSSTLTVNNSSAVDDGICDVKLFKNDPINVSVSLSGASISSGGTSASLKRGQTSSSKGYTLSPGYVNTVTSNSCSSGFSASVGSSSLTLTNDSATASGNCSISFKYDPTYYVYLYYTGATSSTSYVTLKRGKSTTASYSTSSGYTYSNAKVKCTSGYSGSVSYGKITISSSSSASSNGSCYVVLAKNSSTSDFTYTAPVEGTYAGTVCGAAGAMQINSPLTNPYGYTSGKGGCYNYSIYLYQGDTLSFDIGSTSGNNGAGSSGYGNSGNNGGGASWVYLKRYYDYSYTSSILTAGGGGGGKSGTNSTTSSSSDGSGGTGYDDYGNYNSYYNGGTGSNGAGGGAGNVYSSCIATREEDFGCARYDYVDVPVYEDVLIGCGGEYNCPQYSYCENYSCPIDNPIEPDLIFVTTEYPINYFDSYGIVGVQYPTYADVTYYKDGQYYSSQNQNVQGLDNDCSTWGLDGYSKEYTGQGYYIDSPYGRQYLGDNPNNYPWISYYLTSGIRQFYANCVGTSGGDSTTGYGYCQSDECPCETNLECSYDPDYDRIVVDYSSEYQCVERDIRNVCTSYAYYSNPGTGGMTSYNSSYITVSSFSYNSSNGYASIRLSS